MSTRGAGRIFHRLNSKFLWLQYNVSGQTHRESARTSKVSEARELLNKRLTEAADRGSVVSAGRTTTLADLVKTIKENYAIKKRVSARTLEYRLRHVIEYFGAHTKARDIRSGMIPSYIAHRQKQGAAPGTVNRELAALKRAYNLALKYEKVASVPKFEMLPEAPPREGFFEPADFHAVRDHLPDYLRDVLWFLYLSGWRTEDVRGLTWGAVDKDLRNIRLPRQIITNKNKPSLLPVTGELAGIMARAKAARRLDCPYVFHRDGRRFRDWRHAWATAVRKVGLAGQLVHDFRRSAVRNLKRAGVDDTVAMKLTGHKTRAVFDNYNITSEDDLADAVARRDQYLAAAPTARTVESITDGKTASPEKKWDISGT